MSTLFAIGIASNMLALFACVALSVDNYRLTHRKTIKPGEPVRPIKYCYRTDDGRVFIREYPEGIEPPDEIDVQTSSNPDLPLLYVARFVGVVWSEKR